jgi:hypothetical protein
VTLLPSAAVLAGGANLIGGGAKIQFDAQTAGESATWTFSSTPGQTYIISVTGHNDKSESFFQFWIDADGPGVGTGFVQLGSDHNFGSGFSTFILPSYVDLGSTDYFMITNGTTGGGRTGNSAGQIEVADVTIQAVPGPMVGAGLPGLLMAFGAVYAWRRRKSAVASA